MGWDGARSRAAPSPEPDTVGPGCHRSVPFATQHFREPNIFGHRPWLLTCCGGHRGPSSTLTRAHQLLLQPGYLYSPLFPDLQCSTCSQHSSTHTPCAGAVPLGTLRQQDTPRSSPHQGAAGTCSRGTRNKPTARSCKSSPAPATRRKAEQGLSWPGSSEARSIFP